MQRMPVPALVGPSNTLRSQNVDCERTENFYLESTQPGNAKAPTYLVSTPGLRPFAQVLDSPGYDLFYQDGRCFTLIGNSFSEVFSNQTTRFRGSVPGATPQLPASMVSNGTAGGQLLICIGGAGFVYNLLNSSFTEITEANFTGTGFPSGNCLMVEYMDGYGIALEYNSRKFFISALNDFTSWDPLDVFERSMGSDNFASMKRSHRELWFPGTKTGEVWSNTGDALTPFAPIPGVFIETGAAGSAVTRAGNTIVWIQQDDRGGGMVMAANGYEPTRISTHAVELSLGQSADLSAARLFTQQQQGHTFVWLYVPDLDTTWVYDWSVQEWHQRFLFNAETGTNDLPHVAVGHAFAFNRYLIVTWDSGIIYELALDVFDDSVVAA